MKNIQDHNSYIPLQHNSSQVIHIIYTDYPLQVQLKARLDRLDMYRYQSKYNTLINRDILYILGTWPTPGINRVSVIIIS